MLTPFYPFSWKWEESTLQFYDLFPLGKISVTPGMSTAQGMENRKYAHVHSVSVSLSVSVCICVTNTYIKIFVCTLKYLCVWVFVTPECCSLLKNSKKCSPAAPVSPTSFSSTVYLFLVLYVSLVGWMVCYCLCRVSQQMRQEEVSGWIQAEQKLGSNEWGGDDRRYSKLQTVQRRPKEARWDGVSCAKNRAATTKSLWLHVITHNAENCGCPA